MVPGSIIAYTIGAGSTSGSGGDGSIPANGGDSVFNSVPILTAKGGR